MIKTTIQRKDNDDNKITYPCLMESDLVIVLFKEKGKGMVMNSNDIFHSKGDYYCCWDMSKFKPFHGTITLHQE